MKWFTYSIVWITLVLFFLLLLRVLNMTVPMVAVTSTVFILIFLFIRLMLRKVFAQGK